MTQPRRSPLWIFALGGVVYGILFWAFWLWWN